MESQNIYVISNGSPDYYPNNTLTHFNNKFPTSFEFKQNENYQIGVQEIGFSSTFRNVLLPKNPLAPSLIISNCQIKDRLGPCIDGGQVHGCDVPVNFHLDNKAHADGCTQWKYVFEDKEYVKEDLTALANKIGAESGLLMKVEDDQIIFEITNQQMIKFKYFWVFMHKSFKETFGFQGMTVSSRKTEAYLKKTALSKIINQVEINNKIHVERKTLYMNEEYFVYFIQKKPYKSASGDTVYLDTSLISNTFDLSQPWYPSYIKVVCDNIQSQILDSTYSKDLLIFSPDYSQNVKFTYKEIESIDFIPLLNSNLTTINIQLLDENNDYLQLQSGHATIVKLILKKMSDLENKSFNVRLTSTQNKEYTYNKLSHFKVKLPTPIILDETWKVCINTISYPNVFATFFEDLPTRQIIFRLIENRSTLRFTFKEKYAYNQYGIVNELNNFLTSNNIGECILEGSKIRLIVTADCQIKLPMATAKVLGFNRDPDKIGFMQIDCYGVTPHVTKNQDNQYVIDCQYPIDINYLKPNYIMLYSNIVKSTIVGGGYAKILKIVPIKETKLKYSLNEFKHRDFYELEHFEIDAIEIQLRAHDGKFINFAEGSQEVIVNLEFNKIRI